MNDTTDEQRRSEPTRAGASAYGSRETEEWAIEDETEASGTVAGEAGDHPAPPDTDVRDADAGDADARPEGAERELDDESRRKAEEFAAEHDPEKHDIAAGEEFRQDGDWTAEQTGGPQVWDADGTLVEGSGPGGDASTQAAGAGRGGGGDLDSGGRRVSDLDEVRDGGYGVGSAAPIDDGAMPLGHPVKAWEDTKTFVTEDHPGYGDAEPHVWFTDAAAAQDAGFGNAC